MTRESDVSVTPSKLLDPSWHKLTNASRPLGFSAKSPEWTNGDAMTSRDGLAFSAAGGLPTEVSGSLEWLNRYIDDMTATVSAITLVSKQARLIAFNARIEAARHQSVGNSFAVIADEMKLLAVELMPITAKLETQLFEMRHKISELNDTLDLMSEYGVGPQRSDPSSANPEPQLDGGAGGDSHGDRVHSVISVDA